MKALLLPLLAMLVFSGCGVMHPRIPGSGFAVTQSREVPPFHEIKVSGFGTVNVTAGHYQSVHVTTDDNLLEFIETTVEDGRLKIRPKSGIRPRTDVVVDVTVPELTKAKVSGAGEINVYDVVGESLELAISGAGCLNASGQVNHVKASISGAGSADLQELYALTADMKISGAGSAEIYACESVDAGISGAGSIVCYGNPKEIDKRISGVGSISTPHCEEVPVSLSLGDEQTVVR